MNARTNCSATRLRRTFGRKWILSPDSKMGISSQGNTSVKHILSLALPPSSHAPADTCMCIHERISLQMDSTFDSVSGSASDVELPLRDCAIVVSRLAGHEREDPLVLNPNLHFASPAENLHPYLNYHGTTLRSRHMFWDPRFKGIERKELVNALYFPRLSTPLTAFYLESEGFPNQGISG